jgi:ABC-type Fe3+-siderophore transport system permease subunit
MKESITKYFQQIWATPFVHGLGVTVSGAVTGAIISIVNGFIQPPHTMPTIQNMASFIGFAALSAIVAYLDKNGRQGSSNITPPPPATNQSK